jgi:hypothetical protein
MNFGADKLKILFLIGVYTLLTLSTSQEFRNWMARILSGESSAVTAPASAASSRRAAVRKALDRFLQANYQPCSPLQKQLDACAAEDAACRDRASPALAACTATMGSGNKAVRSQCSGYFSALSECALAGLGCGREAENMLACRQAVEAPFIKKIQA